MSPYNINLLAADLQNWIDTRFLLPILSIEGGWEYWVQIDFPCWLDTHYGNQFDFRREVMDVLPAGGRLDWLINSQSPPGPANPVTAVEIKAQTHRYITSAFINNVQQDINKLQTLVGQYNKLMLAVVCDPAAQTALTNQGFVQFLMLPNNSGAFFAKTV